MPKKISVIIPTFNRVGYLLEALESVYQQTHKNIQVIVVDDGSTDNTEEVMRSYPRPVTYIRQENQGLASARNRGIAEASGDFLAFLDNDDVWELDKLEVQLKALEENPDAGLVYSRQIYIDALGRPMDLRYDCPCYEGYIFEKLFLECFIPISSVMMSKTCVDKIGGFRKDFPAIEDYEYFFRVCAQFPVKLIDRPLLRYRKHSSNMSKNVLTMQLNVVRVLEDVLRERQVQYPILKTIAPRRLQPLYDDVGHEYFHRNEIKNARMYLLKSFRIKPWNPRTILFLMISLLGQDVVTWLKAIRKNGRVHPAV